MSSRQLRLGFVSTRLEGTDGVSLEAFKWAQILEEMGHECFYFSGACDRRADRSRVISEAHFKHELVEQINRDLFDDCRRSRETTDAVHAVWRTLERAVRDYINDFALDGLIVENALSLPMNVPLRGQSTLLPTPTASYHSELIAARWAVSTAVVPLPSAR